MVSDGCAALVAIVEASRADVVVSDVALRFLDGVLAAEAGYSF